MPHKIEEPHRIRKATKTRPESSKPATHWRNLNLGHVEMGITIFKINVGPIPRTNK